MHTPTSEQVLIVIRNFEKVLPLATLEGHLDMAEGDVNINHLCGTFHCHAGWYAIATCDLSEKFGHTKGAMRLAEDLGFDDHYYILEWARDNPEIWGNNFGYDMFLYEKAFTSSTRPEGAKTLLDIVNHWREVFDRIESKELDSKRCPVCGRELYYGEACYHKSNGERE